MTWRYPTLRVGQLTEITRTLTVFDDDAPNYDERGLDLTDAVSVTLTMDHRTRAFTPVEAGECTITDAENGEVEYTFGIDETAVYGDYWIQFEIEWSNGETQLSPPDGFEHMMAVAPRQSSGPTPLTVSTLEANEVNVGSGGITGLASEAVTWLDGPGLSVVDGELVMTAEFDGITGTPNPFVENVSASGFLLKDLGTPVDPGDAVPKSAHDTKADQADVDANTTSITDLETNKADREGDDIHPARLNNTRIIAPSIPGCFDTLYDALADLPAEGGVIYLAETCTETQDIAYGNPFKLVGQGSTWATPTPAHISLGGNTLHLTGIGATIEQTKFVNGNIIIGQHGANQGRHHLDFHIQDSVGTGVEFRGGHMESEFHIVSNGAGGDGLTWNLDTESASDYFNDNELKPTVANCTGDAYVMTGIGAQTYDIHGNEFRDFRAEQVGGTAWVVDSHVDLKANFMSGFGVHDGGVNVQPAVAQSNTIDFGRLKGGGTLNVGGPVRVPRTRRDATALGPNTSFWDHANAGGMTKGSLDNFVTHAATATSVPGNSWQEIFNRTSPVTVECGTITGHNIKEVRATWSDGTTSLIYRNTSRGADNNGNYQSVKSLPRIQNVKKLEFYNNAASSYEYGWDVTTSTYQ